MNMRNMDWDLLNTAIKKEALFIKLAAYVLINMEISIGDQYQLS